MSDSLAALEAEKQRRDDALAAAARINRLSELARADPTLPGAGALAL